jgi:hypothetical protein
MSENNTHTHEHEDGHCHSHEAHEHKEHSTNEDVALLKYMIEHNRHHNEDLHELYHALDGAGKKDAAALVGEAMHFYDHGNEKLANALKLLGGE